MTFFRILKRPGFIAALLLVAACGGERESPPVSPLTAPAHKAIPAPSFNEDSALAYVAAQVNFGPRVPGTPAHAACANYLARKLESFGLEVIMQRGVVTTYNNRKFELSNVIGSYRPERGNRILLCSHWDTRPFADRDSINPDQPFDGANDGGSSTAVLLEVARQLSLEQPDLGIDIILFDLEDYGEYMKNNDESWGLGSQYWSRNLHKPGYFARYGILVDMVGAPGAVFPREGYSMQYASEVVDKVWRIARKSGYGKYFIDDRFQGIVDDHYFVNKIAGIPCINIIHYDLSNRDFMSCHHRHCDNMDQIDSFSLKVAGQVLLETLYHELNAAQ